MNGLVFCYLESQLQNPGHNGQTWLGFPFLLLPSGWACNLKHHLLRSCSPALLSLNIWYSPLNLSNSQLLPPLLSPLDSRRLFSLKTRPTVSWRPWRSTTSSNWTQACSNCCSSTATIPPFITPPPPGSHLNNRLPPPPLPSVCWAACWLAAVGRWLAALPAGCRRRTAPGVACRRAR